MIRIVLLLIGAGAVAGCSSVSPAKQTAQASAATTSAAATAPATVRAGGYYLDDGPGDNPPANMHAIADAVPRAEPFRAANLRPYEALGMRFVPIAKLGTFAQEGMASWYGRRFHGKPTASGEIYDMYAMTAAHPTLPIPSYARVTALDSGKSVVVRINDRGPFHANRVIDLSYTAAYKLGMLGKGSKRVRVESIDPEKPAAVVAASAPSPAGAENGGHYVQVGAFGHLENAERLLQRARLNLGIAPELSRVMLVGTLHRVSLGPFQNELEAGNWADRTRATLGIEAIKTRYY